MENPIEWWLATETEGGMGDLWVYLYRGEPELPKCEYPKWQSGPGGRCLLSAPQGRFTGLFPDAPIPKPGTCRQVEVIIREPGTLDKPTVEACAKVLDVEAAEYKDAGNASHAGDLEYVAKKIRNLTKEGKVDTVQEPPADR